MKRLLIFLFLLCGLCSSFGGLLSSPKEEKEHPLLPADTSSPRATLNTFMENCTIAYTILNREGRNSDNVEAVAEAHQAMRRIERCLDLTQIADFRRDNMAREAAVSLKEILDRIELPKEKEIPDRADMTLDEETGVLKESWTIPNTEITLQLINEGPHKGTYKFNDYTVKNAPEFYKRVKHLDYKDGATEDFAHIYLTQPGKAWLSSIVNHLPQSMRDRNSGQAVWQWIGIIVVIIGMILFMVLVYSIGRRVSRGGAEGGMLKYLLGLAFPIIAVLIPLRALITIENVLVVSGTALYILKFNLSLLSLFAQMVVVLGIGRRVGEVIVSAPHIRSHSIDAQLIRVMSRMMGVVAAIVLLLQGGQHLGIPLSSLLAGAGVAGAALALSAQDVLKNMFGSIMIILDKPFAVGERIAIKQYDGIVEEVGLRSTKLRLLNGHQAIIPNEEMARGDIENIGRRPFIRRVSNIPLKLDIDSAQATKAVDLVKEILKDHEGMQPDYPPRVWLNEFERDHISLRMIYWYHPPAYWDYTAYAQKVNEQIIAAFAANGIEIARPAFSTRVEQGGTAATDAIIDVEPMP